MKCKGIFLLSKLSGPSGENQVGVTGRIKTLCRLFTPSSTTVFDTLITIFKDYIVAQLIKRGGRGAPVILATQTACEMEPTSGQC